MKKTFRQIKVGQYFFSQKFGVCVRTVANMISDLPFVFAERKNAFGFKDSLPVCISDADEVIIMNPRRVASTRRRRRVSFCRSSCSAQGVFRLRTRIDKVNRREFVLVKSDTFFEGGATSVTALLLGGRQRFKFIHDDQLASVC